MTLKDTTFRSRVAHRVLFKSIGGTIKESWKFSERRHIENFMIRKNVIAFVMMLAVSSAGMAFASDIYKWTDEHGNVHYGDRPTNEASEERLGVSSKPTDHLKVQARSQSRYAAMEAVQESAPSEPQGPTEDELRAQALERQEKCATYKARLRKFLTSRHLYRADENGERGYLDEGETLAARERVQKQVEKYCNP